MIVSVRGNTLFHDKSLNKRFFQLEDCLVSSYCHCESFLTRYPATYQQINEEQR